MSEGFLSKKAHIRMPAFDVDVNGAPGFPPEVDRVSFNGHDLGTLTGDNNIWKLNEFNVPIDWVKFPSRGTLAAPSPADNVIQIDIDTASVPNFNWCTSIDWVEIEFDAFAPIFLVHGTNAQSTSWEPHFTAFFRDSHALWSNDINLEPNGSILGNGELLAKRVQELADSFGATKCHIIAHSKGGLDTRAYLNKHYDPDKLRVLSVYTLGTPHHGTIISDIVVARRAATNPESSNADIKYLIENDYTWFTPKEPAIGDQTTASMGTFNKDNPTIPGDVLFYNYGADADLNHNSRIEANETSEMPIDQLPFDFMKAAAGTAMYRAIGNIASITVTEGTRPGRFWGTKTFTAIEVKATNKPFAVNDLVTSVDSAHSPGGKFLAKRAANHSSMKSTALATTILEHIMSDFPIR